MLIETYENKSLEKYGYIGKDPIDEGNFFSNFVMHWAYKIIHLSKLINIKSEYLGTFSYERRSEKYLKDIYYDFCFEEDLAIRLSIISSFHEIANMVGKDITQNELLPIYDKFLESNDNYEQKLAIKNLPQILIKVDKKVKERYYKYFEPVSIFIDNTGNKVRNFNFLNWKNKFIDYITDFSSNFFLKVDTTQAISYLTLMRLLNQCRKM